MTDARDATRWKWGLLAVTLLFLYLGGLGSYGLLEPDEGRYAEIPREMLESGDFITPTLNSVKYFEKPVLHYWLTAMSMALFGENEFAVRLWPALLALGGVLLTAWLARDLYGERSALFTSVILSTSLLYFVISQINILDMPVSFFLTAAMAGFWFGLERDRRYYLLFYGGMALALLTKGLIGIVLPCGIVFWYMILTRRWSILRSALYLPGILLFLALSAPWFVAVSRRNSDFLYFFFVHEHFLRYATTIHDRYEPFWFFIPMLIVGLLPWMGLLPGALRAALPRTLHVRDAEAQKGLFLFLWFAVIFLFFSLSGSKLIPYIVPVFPPLAILMGDLLRRLIEGGNARGVRRFLLWTSVVMAPLLIAMAVYPFLGKDLPPSELLPYSLPILFIEGVFLGGAWFLYRRGNFRKMAAVLCVLAIAHSFEFREVLTLFDGLLSARELSEKIATLQRGNDRIMEYKTYDQGLPFYLKQRITLVDYLGELEFGAKQEADPRWFIGKDDLKQAWDGPERIILVVPRKLFNEIAPTLGIRLSDVLAESRKNIVFVNRLRERE